MKTIDFSRSYLTFRIDHKERQSKTVTHRPAFTLNNARILPDCRCEISDRRSGQSQVFVQGASCKTERVGVERDIWIQPNADFVPIFSDERFLTIKTFDRADRFATFYPPSRGVQPDRQSGTIVDGGFDRIRIDVAECEGEALGTSEAIVNAVLANEPLVARTVLENERYRAVLDYPVKTINANERDWIYQRHRPDLFPDLSASRRRDRRIGTGFQLSMPAGRSFGATQTRWGRSQVYHYRGAFTSPRPTPDPVTGR